jgi:hypothetical protein
MLPGLWEVFDKTVGIFLPRPRNSCTHLLSNSSEPVEGEDAEAGEVFLRRAQSVFSPGNLEDGIYPIHMYIG